MLAEVCSQVLSLCAGSSSQSGLVQGCIVTLHASWLMHVRLSNNLMLYPALPHEMSVLSQEGVPHCNRDPILLHDIRACVHSSPACSAARMWPYITEAGERKAKAMLPDLLKENKPTWMTKLELDQSVIPSLQLSIASDLASSANCTCCSLQHTPRNCTSIVLQQQASIQHTQSTVCVTKPMGRMLSVQSMTSLAFLRGLIV